MKYFALIAASALMAAPAYAESHTAALELQGDATAGEEAFNRQCVACHVVVNDDGETLAGRNARTGPNLYGVVMRAPGVIEDFRYSESLVELGEAGEVWDEANFVAYTQDPTGWLREILDDRRARGKMAFQVRDEEDSYNIYAYLAEIGPEIEMSEDGDES